MLRALASRQRACASDRGAAAIELLGMLPILLGLALVLWQGLLAFSAASAADRAARDVARELAAGRATPASVTEVLTTSLPGWLEGGARVRTGPGGSCDAGNAAPATRVTVCLQVPLIAPAVSSPWQVAATAEMPRGASR